MLMHTFGNDKRIKLVRNGVDFVIMRTAHVGFNVSSRCRLRHCNIIDFKPLT